MSQLLAAEGIDTSKLMPKKHGDGHRIQLNKSPDPAPFPPFLPLEIFDNTEFDTMNPDEWLALGMNGTAAPVPAKALLPTDDNYDRGW